MSQRRWALFVLSVLMFGIAYLMLFTLLSTAAVEQGQVVQQLNETRAALERANAALQESIARDSAIPRLQERARALGFVPGEVGTSLPLSLPVTLPADGAGP